jgi:hypothetical protein
VASIVSTKSIRQVEVGKQVVAMDQGVYAYEQGNSAFRSGDIEQALKYYERGCAEASGTILLKLLMNSSQCNLMLRNYDVSYCVSCTYFSANIL